MAKKVEVAVNRDKGLWEVRVDGKPVKGFRTQVDAVAHGEKLAKEEKTKLLVHGKNK